MSLLTRISTMNRNPHGTNTTVTSTRVIRLIPPCPVSPLKSCRAEKLATTAALASTTPYPGGTPREIAPRSPVPRTKHPAGIQPRRRLERHVTHISTTAAPEHSER